jgi:hypothetical protein
MQPRIRVVRFIETETLLANAAGNFPRTGLSTGHEVVTSQSTLPDTTSVVTVVDETSSEIAAESSSSATTTDDNIEVDGSYCEQATVRDVDWPRTAAGATAVEPCPTSDDGNVWTVIFKGK